MSWLDAFFFGYSIQVLGVPFPHENVLNFTGSVTGSDDVANGRTNVNVSGGGGGGGITALTGDVTASGSGSVAATVAGIQGNPVSSTPPIAAQLLIENSGATGSAWSTVSGDSTLSATGAMVNTAVHGATVPAAGSLTTGNGLYVSGVSALSYSALNLAGGSGWVTGVLPTGNQAAQSLTLVGDATSSGGTTTSATTVVGKINGSTVPAGGSLTTGNGLYVSGASALSYSALNLAGGAGWVTGVLPSANQAAQTMGGDVTGTTAASVVSAISGASPVAITPSSLAWLSTTAAPALLQTATAVGSATGATLTIQAQNATGTTSVGGALLLTSGSGTATNGSVQIGIGGSVAKTWTAGTESWASTLTPLYTQGAQTSDAPTNSTTIQVQAPFSVALGGTFNTTNGSTGVSSTVSGVVTAGQVVVFGNQTGIPYTINTWSGTSGTLTANFTGTTNTTNTATRISATAANSLPGNLTLDIGSPLNVANTTGNYLFIKGYLGVNFAAIGGFPGALNTYSCLWMSAPSVATVPSTTNYVIASDGNRLDLNAQTQNIYFQLASVTQGSWSSGAFNFTAATTLTWGSTIAATIVNTARSSTSSGNGAAGNAFSITAQAGQAATGASNNGGAGGNLALLAGVGGTSGSATAGIGGLITKFCGQAWQQITKAGSTYSVDTNSTTSDLVIFTDSTSNTVTITLPAPSAGRLIYVKDKTGKAATHNVTISQHSAETIDGSSSLTLSKNYDAVLLISDGTNWSIIGEYAGSII